MIFLTCWFFNQTFKIVQRTKIFHSLTIHCKFEVAHEYKVIINFAIFTTYKIQEVQVIQNFAFMRIERAIEKPLSFS